MVRARARSLVGEAEVDLRPGGRFRMAWLNTDDEGNRAVMDATISELDPPRVLEMSGDMHGVLRFELEPDGDGTVLTFTSTLELPNEFRTQVLAGWHYHLDALAGALEGRRADLVELPAGTRSTPGTRPGPSPPGRLPRVRRPGRCSS